jgi:protein-disulfide isomerase
MRRPLIVASLAVLLAAGCHARKSEEVPAAGAPVAAPAPVVAELFVMSQCPYGVMAEQALFPALERLGDAVDFRLHYVGQLADDGSLQTMHGDGELRGDLLQICAMKSAPKAGRALVDCMNKDPSAIPGNYDDCAKAAGLDVAAVTACADGDEGKALLKASFQYAEAQGVEGSPTMGIAGEPYEGPRTTESYLRALCGAFAGAKPAACSDLPPPVEVPLTILTDARCESCARAVEVGLQQLKTLFPGLKERTLDYGTDEGKALYATMRASEQRFLPAFLFGDAVQKDPSYSQIERYFQQAGPYRMLAVDTGFDPTAEVCDNGRDDDGNGQIDCADAGCKAFLGCRAEAKGRLEVFVMSQCPFGVKALDAMKEVLAAFGPKMDFRVHFVGDEAEPGRFESLHGPAEVEEDLRQVCAMKYAARGNAWMNYVWCRNPDIASTDWKACVKAPLKAAVLEKCATGDEGRKLLSKDLVLGQELGISASPTWLVNNRYPGNALSADDIRALFCAHNAGTPGCEKSLTKEAGLPAGGCQAQ